MAFQYAVSEYLANESRYDKLGSFYQAKRDYFLHQLEGSRWRFRPAGGSYFQLLDYSHISSQGDMEFAKYLTQEKKVAAIPLSPFYPNGSGDKLLRFCFAKKEETLFEACQILKNI